MKQTVFAPGSIGNAGPGFDVLGLAVDRIGDRVSVALTDGVSEVVEVTGLDAALVPRDPARNASAIAALAWLRAHGDPRNVRVWIDKGLPLSGGLGGSAASSVGGAYAAALASGVATPDVAELLDAAFAGERAVAGRHLDNLAPCVLGGLALVRSVDPIDCVALPVRADWIITLVTPAVRIDTHSARGVLPPTTERALWVQQMANTAGVMHAFATGDGDLLARSFDDLYAAPKRSGFIPHFDDVQRAALHAGAFCCGISGSGPTVVAISENETVAQAAAEAMTAAFGRTPSRAHVVPIAREGARPV